MEINPFIIIIILSLMGPIMSTILRETHGLNMKEQIDEVLNLSQISVFLFKCF